jgi:elongation factor Tu
MSKEVNISILGHVDHGKSSLLAAISNSFSKVGIAPLISYEQIDLAAIGSDEGLKLNRAQIKISGEGKDFVVSDYPSHQDFIKSLISSAHIDGILLVVSAADGPMPQTREHLGLARKLGVEKIAVLINKIDMVSKSLQDMVVNEVKQLLKDVGFECSVCPIIYGSALQARKCGCAKKECPNCGFLFEILNSFESYFSSQGKTQEKETLYVISESSDTPFGMMLAKGSFVSGRLAKDDTLSVLTSNGIKKAKIKGLEVDGEPKDEASNGGSVSIYLEGVSAKEVERGTPLYKDGSKNVKKSFNSLVYVFRKEEDGRDNPLPKKSNLSVSIFGKQIDAKVELPKDRESVVPGDSSFVLISLNQEFFLKKGYSFYLVENGKNIGIGKIIEVGE